MRLPMYTPPASPISIQSPREMSLDDLAVLDPFPESVDGVVVPSLYTPGLDAK